MTDDEATPTPPGRGVLGLVLAAGAGRRMGTPKALLLDDEGIPQTLRTARALLAAGCRETLVVLGAAAADAGRLLADHLTAADTVATVVAPGWERGMGLSLRAGLDALSQRPVPVGAALVTLVDLPDVGPAVYERVAREWRASGARPDALLRATYRGEPGHPVLLGREHWQPLVAELGGDSGAQAYLSRHTVREVSCDDLATGRDTDRPEDLGVARGRDEGSR